MTGTRALTLCVVGLWVAGCADTCASPAANADAPTALVDDSTGGVAGSVTDDALVPIANAMVAFLDREGVSTVTDQAGRYSLSRVTPGPADIAVQALGYNSIAKRIEIRAGEVTDFNALLTGLPIAEPYHVWVAKKGKIFCGTHIRPVVSFAACGAVYGTPLSSLDSFVVPFDLTSQNLSAVEAMVFETQWTPTQVLGSGLNVRWETFTPIDAAYFFTEPVRTFAVAIGKSPLWAMADKDTIKSNVTKHKPPPTYCKPVGPCKFWARVFPFANTLGPTYPVDIAFYVDQTYTHFASEFYGDVPPPGYSAINDG